MNKIDEIARRLAAQEPELKEADADALLESIMCRVDEAEQLSPGLWLRIVRWSSSIAAILLLALFISQQSMVENSEARPDYSADLSAYKTDYNALHQASTTSEALRIIVRERSNRVVISDLKKQFLSARR